MKREKFSKILFAEMVKYYKIGGISEECLRLQHEYDADVPFWLVCVLAEAADETIDPDGFDAWLEAAADWRETVIKPLRSVRVTLKPQTANASVNAFRENIKRDELEAERLHVNRIVKTMPPRGTVADLGRRYLHALGLSETGSAAIRARFPTPRFGG